MTILWCGGEEIDFTGYTSVNTNASYYRQSDFTRCCMIPSTSQYTYSYPAESPYGNDLWFHFYITCVSYALQGGRKPWAIVELGSDKGIYIGAETDHNRIAFYTYDGSTYELLSAESGTSWNTGSFKIDIHLIYGESGVISFYMNGALIHEYTGDNRITGVTDFQRVKFFSPWGFVTGYFSEVIIADESTRLMNLKTLAPDAAGDTNDWNGAYTAIDEVVLNDLDIIYTDAGANDFQCNVTGMPVGSFDVKAVKVSSRISQATGSLGIKTGIKTNSALHLGSTQNPDSSWNEYQEIYQVNPETTNPFTPAEIDALQLALQSQT